MLELPWLESNEAFPPLDQALEEPNGLLAAGADLQSERLLYAYRSGIFPWYNEGEPILWWSPSPRCLLHPAEAHCSKSLDKLLRRKTFSLSCDQAFEQVIRACAASQPGREQTWINEDMLRAYCELHRQGHAHSIEVWQHGNLVGGLYGLAIGGAFFGESMFSRVSNASKAAFISLCRHLDKLNFSLVDCQVSNEHLFSLGAYELEREHFIERLEQALNRKTQWQGW